MESRNTDMYHVLARKRGKHYLTEIYHTYTYHVFGRKKVKHDLTEIANTDTCTYCVLSEKEPHFGP